MKVHDKQFNVIGYREFPSQFIKIKRLDLESPAGSQYFEKKADIVIVNIVAMFTMMCQKNFLPKPDPNRPDPLTLKFFCI